MNVKGVGGTYSYLYDASTGKIATKDGSKNEFVDYYNGELKGEDSKSLNGFDARMKNDIQNLIMIFSSGIGKNPFANTVEDNKFEISGNIVDAVTTEYFVDGQKLFTSHSGMSLSIPEMLDYIEKSQPFEKLMAEGNDLTTEQNVHLDFVKEVGIYTDKSAPMSDAQQLVMLRLEKYSYQSLAERANSTSELQTYQALCKQFPNISFRLTDRSEQYGFYENGFHQKGKNFGGHGQCSIDIDIEVIRRMQSDEDYALRVQGSIERIERNYAEYEAEGNADGYQYTCASLSHEDGRLVTSITHSMQPFSTEEEIKEKWGLTDDIADRALHYVSKIKNDLLEDYMAMQDKEENKS